MKPDGTPYFTNQYWIAYGQAGIFKPVELYNLRITCLMNTFIRQTRQ